MIADAFPRWPSPHPAPPTAEEIAVARKLYEQHIPSRVDHRVCIAEGCGGWPCREYRWAVRELDRAGLIDVNGDLRA